MATTKPDIVIIDDTWFNLYSLASVTPSTEIIIQNKGQSDLLINYLQSPDRNSEDGFILTPKQAIKTGTQYIWVKSILSSGTIYVEEV